MVLVVKSSRWKLVYAPAVLLADKRKTPVVEPDRGRAELLLPLGRWRGTSRRSLMTRQDVCPTQAVMRAEILDRWSTATAGVGGVLPFTSSSGAREKQGGSEGGEA